MSEQPTQALPGATLTVGEVAREAEVAQSAVRFYEKHGLISAHRTAGNQRRFTASAGCWIKVARVAQRVGLSVREIAELFDGMPDDLSVAEWERIGDQLVESAYARIHQLEAALTDLGSDHKLCELPRH